MPKYHISGSDSNTFSADQIVEKTLIAKKKVQLKRLPTDDAKVIFTVQPGGTVGRVYSWTGGTGASALWWMFYDEKGQVYYAKHEQGLFDITVIKEQGASTVKTTTQKEAEAKNDSILPTIKNPFGEDFNMKKVAMYAIGGVVLLGAVTMMWPRPQYGMVRIRGIKKRRRTTRRR